MCWLFYYARPRAVVESKRVCQAILTWAFASDLTSCLLCSSLSHSPSSSKNTVMSLCPSLCTGSSLRGLWIILPLEGFYCCLFHSERISDNYIRVFCIPSVQCEPHENRFGSLPPPSSFFFRCVCPCVCPHAHAMRMLLICVKSVCMCRVLASMHNGMQSPEKNVRCPPPSTSFPGDSVNLDIGPVVGLTVSTLHRTFLCAQVCPASYMANRDSA